MTARTAPATTADTTAATAATSATTDAAATTPTTPADGPTRTAPPVGVPVLQARGLSVGYDREPVLRDLDLRIERGTVTTFLGANGCGKSTLLKAFGRVLRPQAGEVLLDGTPIRREPNRAVARKLAILPQTPVAPAGTSVLDLVMRGRNPHQSWARPWTAEDADVAEQAIAATGLTEVAHRDVASLSGGQRQRAWIALVVAQQAETLLLDEPTTYLDLAHQLDVLRLVRRLNREQGSTVVMVLHEVVAIAQSPGLVAAAAPVPVAGLTIAGAA